MVSLTNEQRKTIVAALRAWLGKDGYEFFVEMLATHGTVSAVFSVPYGNEEFGPQKYFPHPVHFREGMQVRNFLRGLPETGTWTDHDYDNLWAPLVTEAVSYNPSESAAASP